MLISKIRWTNDRVNHISKHNLTPDEVEEAAFNNQHTVVQKLKKSQFYPGKKLYRLLSITQSGRLIAFIFIYEGKGIAYPVTARDMTTAERRYYHERY